MVDISMEILASSVPIRNGYILRYRIKTWWTHIDVPPDVTYLKLPKLPIIQPFLVMTGKDTTIFVETWQDQRKTDEKLKETFLIQKTILMGITTCSVDEQLKISNLNPSVQWLDVYDPVENTSRGKMLIKIDAKFVFPRETIPSNLNHRSNSPHSPCLDNQYRGQNEYAKSSMEKEESTSHKFLFSPTVPTSSKFSSSRQVQPVNSFQSRVVELHSDFSTVVNPSRASTRSQEQGVQTDFQVNIPITEDFSKFTDSEKRQSYSPPFASGDSDSSKYVEVIPMQILSTPSNNKKDKTELLTSSASSTRVNSCLVREKNHQEYQLNRHSDFQQLKSEYSICYDSDSHSPINMRQTIDDKHHDLLIRNASRTIDGSNSNSLSKKHNRKSSNSSCSCDENEIKSLAASIINSDDTRTKNGNFSSVMLSSLENQQGEQKSSSACDMRNRFKEIRFDEGQAQQAATNILMAGTGVSIQTTHPPVTRRRRIAAAIYND